GSVVVFGRVVASGIAGGADRDGAAGPLVFGAVSACAGEGCGDPVEGWAVTEVLEPCCGPNPVGNGCGVALCCAAELLPSAPDAWPVPLSAPVSACVAVGTFAESAEPCSDLDRSAGDHAVFPESWEFTRSPLIPLLIPSGVLD